MATVKVGLQIRTSIPANPNQRVKMYPEKIRNMATVKVGLQILN
jgi:hypothetical protein